MLLQNLNYGCNTSKIAFLLSFFYLLFVGQVPVFAGSNPCTSAAQEVSNFIVNKNEIDFMKVPKSSKLDKGSKLSRNSTSSGSAMVTYTSVMSGAWTDGSTWVGGVAPPFTLNAGDIVIIDADSVYFTGNNLINNGGSISIINNGKLQVATAWNIENKGSFEVNGSSLIQFRFVGGGDSGVPQAGTFKNQQGGRFFGIDSRIEIAQDWVNESGAKRYQENGCLLTGQNYTNSGSTTQDTMVGSCISVGWHGSGNIQNSDARLLTSGNTKFDLRGTSGSFQLNSGNITGSSVQVINVANPANLGGQIFASTSVVGTMALPLYCIQVSTNYIPNGKFTGAQVLDCVAAALLFPCSCTVGAGCVIDPGSIASNQTICSGGDPAAFTSVPATGNGTITYQWQSGISGCLGIFTDIPGATSETYNVPAGLTITTNYIRIATNIIAGDTCSASSNCVTVTVNDITPGSIAADQTICSGGNPAAFTSVAATGSGVITYQWQSSTGGCMGTFADIIGATSETYDVPLGLTVTTSYRRVATSTLNGVACSGNSNCVTVTVNDITPGSIAADQTICSGGNPAAFTSVAATGSGVITYQWQSSTGGCMGTFADIIGATSETYDVPLGLTVTTSYRRVATSTLNGVACSGNSNCVTVTVNDITPGSIAADQTICSGGNPAAFTSVAATGSGVITYQWQSSTGGCMGTFADIIGATSETYDVPLGLTVTTSYRRVATSTLNGVACSANSNCVTVTVNNITPGSIAADQTICSGGNPAAFTSVAATGSGVITYQWQSSTGGCMGTFADIIGATSETYDVPLGLTVTTSYRRVATSTLNGVACSGNSNCVTVTVNDITPGSIAADQTICSGGNPAAFTSVAATGSGVITYQWQSSTGGCMGTFADIIGATSETYDVPLGLTVTTSYRRVATSTLNGVACSGNSNCVTVTVNDITPGSIAADQTICSGGNPAAFTSVAATGSGVITYQWQSSTGGCMGTFADIIGATSETYDVPLGLTVTTSYRRVATSTLNGVACSANSNCVTVTVNNITPGSIAADQTICSGGNPAAFTSVAATGSGVITYQWQSSTGGCMGTFADIIGATSETYDVPLGLTVTTSYRRVATSTLNGVACSANSNCVTVTVNDITPGSIAADQTICSGGNPAAFTSVAATGSGVITYQWQSSTGGCIGTFADIIGATSETYDVPPGLTVTTSYRRVATSTLNGVACSANSNCVTVTVTEITSLTAVPGPCDPLTNTYTLTGMIQFNNPPNSGTLTVSVGGNQQVFNAPFSSPTNYSIPGLTADGAMHSVTAIFSDGPQCSKSTIYTAPANCLPVISHSKSFVSATQTAANNYSVVYTITVSNNGGNGQYDLIDVPGFDDDIVITSASFITNAPGNPGGALAGTGPWILANDQAILTGQIHTYTLTVNVSIDLVTVSSPGDENYIACGEGTGGVPSSNQGLFNQSNLDLNNDGIPEEKDTACADVPFLIQSKSVVGVTSTGANSFEVEYKINVENIGGAIGQYNLSDAPSFDNDIVITGANYTSNAVGNPGNPGPLVLAGTGPWTLATNQNILAGGMQMYNIKVNVMINLEDGVGDNVYDECGNAVIGQPKVGEGLFNESRMDVNRDGTTDQRDTACTDLPYLIHSKSVVGVTSTGANSFEVEYKITVQNSGGISTLYNLSDAPSFDNDIVITSSNYTSNASGNPGNPGPLVLAGTGPWTLAANQNILAGGMQMYNLKVNVTINLEDGIGDNIYDECGNAVIGQPKVGEGLFNESRMDVNRDGSPDKRDTACTDLPYLIHSKSVVGLTSTGANSFEVEYKITVENRGGISTLYNLSDAPSFDNDIVITSSNYTSNASGNPGNPGPLVLAGTGPWTLAANQNILAGGMQMYNLKVNVTINLEDGIGDNIYDECGNAVIGQPKVGEGLFNESRMDVNRDGTPDKRDTACTDLPYLIHSKSVVGVTSTGANSFEVEYKITVENRGGISTLYNLSDAPSFDNDIVITSSNYTSNAVGNPGNPGPLVLAGTGPWTLAANQNILAGGMQMYNIKVNVTINLEDGVGDNVYDECGNAVIGQPKVGEGLFNESRLDINRDGTPDQRDTACTDLPYLIHSKSVVGVTSTGATSFEVEYKITVENRGGTPTLYNLSDAQSFDNDIVITSTNYTSNAVGNPGNPGPLALAGTGPWTLATNQNILAGGMQMYNLKVNVTINLEDGIGDNIYDECGNAVIGQPKVGEGLFNESRMDVNRDGTPDKRDTACTDLPYLIHSKSVVGVTSTGANSFEVEYKITVQNSGGISTLYNLSDAPSFDNDIVITSSNYTSNAVGNPGNPGPLVLAGTGPWTLAANQNILAGGMQMYNLKVNVTINLEDGIGDNIYDECGNAVIGQPKVGEGLFNEARLDINRDGTPDQRDTACADLPYLIHSKSVVGVTSTGATSFEVEYKITVENRGGTPTLYNLSDAQSFDNDIVITSANYTSNAVGNPGNPGPLALAGTGPWTLATNQNILAGSMQMYNLKVNVTIDLTDGVGDNVYDECGNAVIGQPKVGEGLFNESRMDVNRDGTPDRRDTACADVPFLIHTKSVVGVTSTGANSFEVEYKITVENKGGTPTLYNLSDAQNFDNDIIITSANYTSNALGNPGNPGPLVLAGTGPWTLATNQNILAGSMQMYNIKVNVTINLEDGVGNNIYDECGNEITGRPKVGEGLFNESRLDINRDGTPDQRDTACTDLPFLIHSKSIAALTNTGLNTYQVEYKITVENRGGISTQYNLSDAPNFENDIVITSSNYTSNAVGNPGNPGPIVLAGTGPWTLATNQNILAGGMQMYNIKVNVTINLADGVGDNQYDECGNAVIGQPKVGEGLFNESRMDVNRDGTPDRRDTACTDIGQLASYRDYVWHDRDADGQQEAGEEGISGVTVILYDGITHLPVRSTITDVNGLYKFENLLPGFYYAKFIFDPVWNLTDPNVGNDLKDSDVDGSNGPRTTPTTYLSPGENDFSWDAGLWKCVCVIGDVWLDYDKDGIYDPIEKGINGLSVHLINALTGAIVSSVVTGLHPTLPSGDGYFKFACVEPGSYYVRTDRPGHLGATDPYKGTDRNKDSDITHENGINTTAIFNVKSGDILSGIGAGFQVKSVVGDYCWFDKNFNGVQELNEAPIKDVLVQAINDNGVIVSEAISASDGNYKLDGMIQGDYFMKFIPPSGNFGFTTSNMGDENMDSDVDGTNGYGTTKTYRIISGDELQFVDAGFVATILPLEWLSFEGNYNGSFTELEWTTGVEINNEHFVVERRHDSERNFMEIGKELSQNNNSVTLHKYSYNDYKVTQSGIYYYRIKQVDRNGSFTYSKTIAIRVDSDLDLNVFIYPNPVDDLLKIEIWLSEDAEIEAKVIDENGKIVIQRPFDKYMKAGKKQEFLNTSVLPSGHYVIQVKTATGFVNKKFSVVR